MAPKKRTSNGSAGADSRGAKRAKSQLELPPIPPTSMAKPHLKWFNDWLTFGWHFLVDIWNNMDEYLW